MDDPLHRPASLNGSTAVNATAEISSDPFSSCSIGGPKSAATIAKRHNRKKEQTLVLDSTSSASSSNCCCSTSCSQKGIKISRKPRRVRVGSLTTTRKRVGNGDVDALGLPLGMTIAAVVAQVLERKNVTGEKMSMDYLFRVCSLAVWESLGNVFGDKFDNFVISFDKSFRSKLMTLRLISASSHNVGEHHKRAGFRGSSISIEGDKLNDSVSPGPADDLESLSHRNETEQHIKYQHSSFGETSKLSPFDRIDDAVCQNDTTGSFDPLPLRIRADGESYSREQMKENLRTNLMNQQLVLHDKGIEHQLACGSASSSNSAVKQSSVLSTIEKSIMEQTRSNDLKTFEIGLVMKKLQLKEKQLALNSHANLLERWKISMDFSKASFKAKKFKTQLQDAREVELLKKCLDFLVAGLIIILLSIAYGTYVYSHRRIVEATEACFPYTESSKSWWMPKYMAAFNPSLQLLICQIQVLSRMFFSALMIGAIAFLLIQRSTSSHQTMPLTFILLLLGVACGYAGKFCVNTLGGSGCLWLIYWEAFCLLHFFSNTFHSILFSILNGPIILAERVEHSTFFPYWMRRFLFFATLLFLPLLSGFMPFASPREWFNHFSSKT